MKQTYIKNSNKKQMDELVIRMNNIEELIKALVELINNVEHSEEDREYFIDMVKKYCNEYERCWKMMLSYLDRSFYELDDKTGKMRIIRLEEGLRDYIKINK